MTYTKKQINDLKDYLLQQIRNNEAQARYLMREEQLVNLNYKAIQTCLKENNTYFKLIDILDNTYFKLIDFLDNTETID